MTTFFNLNIFNSTVFICEMSPKSLCRQCVRSSSRRQFSFVSMANFIVSSNWMNEWTKCIDSGILCVCVKKRGSNRQSDTRKCQLCKSISLAELNETTLHHLLFRLLLNANYVSIFHAFIEWRIMQRNHYDWNTLFPRSKSERNQWEFHVLCIDYYVRLITFINFNGVESRSFSDLGGLSVEW